MAEYSKIGWTTHTFNGWAGCQRVSPACENCYAETQTKRYGYVQWGPQGQRRVTSAANWRLPLKWNREAHSNARRDRVFCASWADVFEDFHGEVVGDVTSSTASLDYQRARLFHLIEQTEHLDWLLLTKRPENIARMLPREWAGKLPPNIWLGTTVENQLYADRRIPHLLQHDSVVRFLSVEPQLGPVNLSSYIDRIDWVICGGESGAGSRPTQVEWARSVREQTKNAGKSFFFKQWGQFAQLGSSENLIRLRTKDERVLDGREWSEIPTPRLESALSISSNGAPRRNAWEHILGDGDAAQ